LNPIVKYILIAVVVLGVVGGMIYKATNPNDYKHPRHRSM